MPLVLEVERLKTEKMISKQLEEIEELLKELREQLYEINTKLRDKK